MWAARAAKMGYASKLGNDRKMRLWEDQWIGTCSLGYSVLGIYFIINEQGSSICEGWNEVNLKFTFWRTVNRDITNQLQELLQIASNIQLCDEEDATIWQYNSSYIYSVQSLYAIVKDRGLNRFLLFLCGKLMFFPGYTFFSSFWLIIKF
jgi:hypothetical protein